MDVSHLYKLFDDSGVKKASANVYITKFKRVV